MGGSQSAKDKPAHRVESKGEGTGDRRKTSHEMRSACVADSVLSSLLAADEPLIKQATDQELCEIVARKRSLLLFLKALVAPHQQHLVRA